MFKKSLSLLALAAMLAPAFAAEWLDNFDSAKAKAAAEQKLVLMDFTGSDWCGWCIKLRKEVLDKPEFEAYAKDKFVLMEVDCPRKKKLPAKLTAQNNALCQQYHVSGFPTLLAVTPEGKVVGGFGGYMKYDDIVRELDDAFKAEKALKEAEALPAEQQETALDAVYRRMNTTVRNAGGYKTMSQQTVAAQRAEFEKKIMASQSVEEWLKNVDECLAVSYPGNKMYLLDQKFTALVNSAETVEDLAAARKVGDELIEVLPNHLKNHIKGQIERDFADPAALLERVKASRGDK